MKYVWSLILIFSFVSGYSQEKVSGTVSEQSDEKVVPLAYATVYWADTRVGTITDGNGHFSIKRVETTTLLVASYTGLTPDTLDTKGQNQVKFILRAEAYLEEAVVSGEKKSTSISSLDNIKTEILSEKEFKKAACCNLSESFETNPTVEVSFADALTGIRQIRMLGLNGTYAQTLVENIPMMHGIQSYTGLTYIPGSFVESVHLSKGAGSVVYGFESMTGQINIGLKKPETGSRLFVNGYQNLFGRSELNLVSAAKVNEHWSTALLAHGNITRNNRDPNNDGFLNLPSGEGINLINRWKYNGENWESQIGVRYVNEQRISGQMDYRQGMDRDSLSPYGVEYRNRAAGVWAKLGRPATELNKTSIGFIVNANHYENDFLAGLNTYRGVQENFNGSFIFNRNLDEEHQVLSGGLSLMADQYREKFNTLNFSRTEVVPGIFAEYTYKLKQKFSAVMGLRFDYHNLFGAFFTPRLHLRYAITENHVLRASAGRGQRTANIFTENTSIFISSRKLRLNAYDGTYGLDPEVTWNFGGNYTYTFPISAKRTGQFSIDYYYVHFVNQAVVDRDNSAREVWIYNLNGSSFSQTVQAQVTLEPVKRFEVRLAYRYLDVQTTFTTGLRQRPMIPVHRGFINLAYSTRSKWDFDLTTQFIGKQRLPDLAENPEVLRFSSYSPAFMNLNAQVTKTLGNWQIYVGGENLLNVVQQNLIVDAANPYGTYFDASMVWGPAMGAMVYTGFRYELK